eukprot:tig00001333_g8192.t1
MQQQRSLLERMHSAEAVEHAGGRFVSASGEMAHGYGRAPPSATQSEIRRMNWPDDSESMLRWGSSKSVSYPAREPPADPDWLAWEREAHFPKTSGFTRQAVVTTGPGGPIQPHPATDGYVHPFLLARARVSRRLELEGARQRGRTIYKSDFHRFSEHEAADARNAHVVPAKQASITARPINEWVPEAVGLHPSVVARMRRANPVEYRELTHPDPGGMRTSSQMAFSRESLVRRPPPAAPPPPQYTQVWR